MFALIISFFGIALAYAIVGFGGGSSYIAILSAADVTYTLIPKITLFCNLLVVTGGAYHYFKNGHLKWRLVLPFVLSSVPMAFWGGTFSVKEKTFFILLTGSLILCGIRLLFLPDRPIGKINQPSIFVSLVVGGILGLLSGVIGIGGGIFLSPILINMGWARAKNAAAVASIFIFVNSISGLFGQFAKNDSIGFLQDYYLLFIAVFVGGQIGSRIGTHPSVSFSFVQKCTGVLTLFICIKLLLKVVS